MKKLKTTTILIILITIFVLFYIFGRTVTESVKLSLNICYSSVIPSLFPYFVITEIIITTLGTTTINPTVYAFIGSQLSGFPSGTSSVCNLYDNGVINKKQAVSLLYCTANASPAFIISFIGICILKSKTIGMIILIAQVISSIICVIIFNPLQKAKNTARKINYSELITSSISKSVNSTLSVCGYITFMGIIADIIKHLKIDLFVSKILSFIPSEIIKPVFIGMFEMTRGIMLIDSENKFSVITASMIIGFSGISVILQCIRFSSKSGLPSYPIIVNKIAYILCMPVITALITKIVKISYIVRKKEGFNAILPLFIVFSLLLIYLIFDKFLFKIYNKEKS